MTGRHLFRKDAEAQTIVSKPMRKTKHPSLSWEVLTLRQDPLRPWVVTSLRIVPVVHPKMPSQLKIAIERYRLAIVRGDMGDDETLFFEINRWYELSGEADD